MLLSEGWAEPLSPGCRPPPRQKPPFPEGRMTDRRFWKHYLPLRSVTMEKHLWSSFFSSSVSHKASSKAPTNLLVVEDVPIWLVSGAIFASAPSSLEDFVVDSSNAWNPWKVKRIYFCTDLCLHWNNSERFPISVNTCYTWPFQKSSVIFTT